jgi:hypothetical protein
VATATQDQAATHTANALAAIALPTSEPSATTTPTATAEPSRTATLAPTETSAPTSEPTATHVPTATQEPPTDTPAPTNTHTPAPLPTSTQPSTSSPYYVQITQITLQDNAYVVSYETIGFVESVQGWHIHFFFDTVPPEQAGVPGAGPWILYYGPSPFTQYTVSDRPANATQMCARIANADHTLYMYAGTLDTGNCVDLP